MNVYGTSQSIYLNKVKVKLSSEGHIKYLMCDKYFATKNTDTKVPIAPPKNPSQVFLGDNLIKGVLPNINPKKYAIASFNETAIIPKMNQKNPDLIIYT